MGGEPILIVEDRTRTGRSSGTAKVLGLTIPPSLLQRATAMPELFAALDAFLQEHRRCGELDGVVEGDRVVWMACDCGATLARGRLAPTTEGRRGTGCAWAIQRGATLPERKDLLGHSSLAMVMRYAHLSPEHLRSAVARLDTVLTPQKITQAITHEPAVETTKGSR